MVVVVVLAPSVLAYSTAVVPALLAYLAVVALEHFVQTYSTCSDYDLYREKCHNHTRDGVGRHPTMPENSTTVL